MSTEPALSPRTMVPERSARLMGTDVHVVVVGPEALADRALARLRDLEARWSRFVPTSEVNRLTASAGRPVEVSADTALLARRAVDAWRVSAGSVDCTELAAVVAAGYDRPFDTIPTDRPDESAPTTTRPLLVGPGEIEIVGSTVTLPAGTAFDPGGIGKGLAADLVATELMESGAEGVCVNVGGDLRVMGAGPRGGGWRVSIDHPHRPQPLTVVTLGDGAVASSTTLKRRWRVGGEERHHLIDPGTGRPSTSDIAFASVLAAQGWKAEALAKAVLLSGTPHHFDLLDGTGIEGLAVTYDGQVTATAGLARFTSGRIIAPTLGA